MTASSLPRLKMPATRRNRRMKPSTMLHRNLGETEEQTRLLPLDGRGFPKPPAAR